MSARVILGDCLTALREFPDGSAQTCVTSPPYYGLRDYGMSEQIGLEETPEAYIARLVDVFREVRRVLRDDGTLWLNIGDSYCGYKGANYGRTDGNLTAHTPSVQSGLQSVDYGTPQSLRDSGIKPKDLIGIPWMLAFALRADGWYLRQDIIWSKPNPMPESVTDRCTKAHEYVFLLSKGPRYYYDHAAVKEPVAASTVARLSQNVEAQAGSDRVPGKTNGPMKAVGGRSRADSFKREDSKRAAVIPGQTVGTHRADRAESTYDLDTRNKRSVWSIATRPFKEAHFAVMPVELAQTCILAGSHAPGDIQPIEYVASPAGSGERTVDPSRTVGRAGMSRPRRDVEDVRLISRQEQAAYAAQLATSPHRDAMRSEAPGFDHYARTDRSGARPIPHALLEAWIGRGWLTRVPEPVPQRVSAAQCTVLDPFMGAHTTAYAALLHGRNAIGAELNPEYMQIGERRIRPLLDQPFLLAHA